MKKILFLIACCLMATAQNVFADDYGKVFLQHNGNITGVFDGSDISKSIEAAVDGDTLFLSLGRFNGNLTINKSICLIGSGAEAGSDSQRSTYIDWGCNPRIDAGDGKILSSVTIEGIYSGPGFYAQGKIENLVFKKCHISNTLGISDNSNGGYTKKAIIDRCRLDNISTDGNIQDATIKNCKIYRVYGQGGQSISACKFINCNIWQVNSNTKAMFVNSIINQVNDGTDSYLSSQSLLVNTLYHNMNGYDPMQNCSQQDCWSSTETLIRNDGNYNCSLTADQLKEAGYLGTDGTIIGCEGGVNPYSLVRHAPVITQKGTKVDLDNKKVIINVNVTAK